MISIDFSFGIALFFLIFIGFFSIAWIVFRKDKHKDSSLDERYIRFCSVCTYTYVNVRDEVISVCPRCGSYNKKGVGQ